VRSLNPSTIATMGRGWLILGAVLVLGVPRCRYTVRDVGFVDLGGDTYVLTVHPTPGLSVSWATAVRRMARSSFADVNARIEIADPQAHPALGGQPGVVLTSPSKRHLGVVLPAEESTLQSGGWDVLDALGSSPVRETIREKLIRAHAVVVVFEGADEVSTSRVRRLAAEAIDVATPRLKDLPKATPVGPELVVVPLVNRERERVLLWALGPFDGEPDDPHVVVLYGRGRRMGPVLSGPMVTRTGIQDALLLVGQDCECDLPRALLRNPAAPIPWSGPALDRVQGLLEFDPRSPSVKAEMSRILARGGSARPGSSEASGLEGYTETVVGGDGSGRSLPAKEPTEPPEKEGSVSLLLLAGAAVVVIALAGAIFVAVVRRGDAR